LSLDALLQDTGLWRASSIGCEFRRRGIPTGYSVLDEYLPGGGWPVDGLTELLYERHGIGEFRLLAPALSRLSRQEDRWIVYLAPPFIPYAPALSGAGVDLSAILVVRPKKRKDMLWALEQALGSGSCSAVLAWPDSIDTREVRRLQVACKRGNSWGVLFRSHRAAKQVSPAELRIRLFAALASPLEENASLDLKILKRRGGWTTGVFPIQFHDGLNQRTYDFSFDF